VSGLRYRHLTFEHSRGPAATLGTRPTHTV